MIQGSAWTQGVVGFGGLNAAMTAGYTVESALGKLLVGGPVFGDFKGSVSQVLNGAFNGNGMANFEFPFSTSGGFKRGIFLNATARRNSDGCVMVIFAGFWDMNTAMTTGSTMESALGKPLVWAPFPGTSRSPLPRSPTVRSTATGWPTSGSPSSRQAVSVGVSEYSEDGARGWHFVKGLITKGYVELA